MEIKDFSLTSGAMRGKINSEWSDKALDQVTKLRKESESRNPEPEIDINQELE